MKVLIMTVGGEDKPLVESILQNEPGWIYFICSAGQNSSRVMVEKDGLVCGRGTKPNILTQTGFPRDKYAILEVDPDDPTDVYKEAKGIMVKHMGDSILADYTGGTKSMASGLLLAALEFDHCQPILMKGPRADLIKVTGDASVPTEINRYNITVSRYLKAFEDLLARQDYGGAREIIRKILRIKDKADLEDHEKEFLGKANLAMLAFDRWDRFEYAEAWEDLVIYNRTYKKTISPEMKACKDRAFKLAGLVNWLKNENSGEDHRDQRQPGKADGHGTVSFNIRNPKKEMPLPVYDLIRNAERRARMEQYDDAVARLYRATELFAQFSLRRIGISTSDITADTLSGLPEEHRRRLEKKRDDGGKLKIGLMESYELLGVLIPNLGRVWDKHRVKILDVIRHRNMSWLAHGFEPVKKEDYARFHERLTAFIAECEEADPDYSKNEPRLHNFPDLPNKVEILNGTIQEGADRGQEMAGHV